jgi:hypothetical protein
LGIPEAAELARTIRVAELDPADFGCCYDGDFLAEDQYPIALSISCTSRPPALRLRMFAAISVTR